MSYQVCTKSSNIFPLRKYVLTEARFSRIQHIICFMDVVSYDINEKADTCFP